VYKYLLTYLHAVHNMGALVGVDIIKPTLTTLYIQYYGFMYAMSKCAQSK